jgi:regulator of cell morphogenesis and NO signaling
MTALTESTTISEVAAAHPETLPVFESHEIDYCCGGAATIAAACAGRKDIDAPRLVAELERAIAGRSGPGAPAVEDPRALSTPALVARIVDRHHSYVRRAAPELRFLMGKVAAAHGAHDPRLLAVARRLDALLPTLLAHLDFEETALFPALAAAAAGRRPDDVIERELATMFADHEEVGEALHAIRALSDGYAVPEWACPTYRRLLTKLRELEGDVHRHVHLENNVLMPRFASGSTARSA